MTITISPMVYSNANSSFWVLVAPAATRPSKRSTSAWLRRFGTTMDSVPRPMGLRGPTKDETR
eukprot:CAMPEP_0197567540 /NCGR_PEP_ID=MMETSP1320-20131121/35779_1 /TAXON_ID=91990 /ORGANISM="Bolidomonas sp., Strain RCC2347" /LENGTH=62 /DNA_ID=CAMNT_0043129737 /DNA_START=54 /DNA_END=239 /DNA_ORIENTATION=+